MSEIKTEDCKKFLIDFFNEPNTTGLIKSTSEKEWKRTKKYKNEKGVLCRDFMHQQLGSFTIGENTGSALIFLGVADTNIFVASNSSQSEYQQRIWSDAEKKGARTIMKKYQELNDKNDTDSIYTTPEWQQWSYALPSQFAFHFPEETYGNVPSAVTNGLLSPVQYNGKYGEDGFNFIMIEKVFDEPDLYSSDMLKHSTLTSWMDKTDEYHFEFEDGAPAGILVKDLIKALLKAGFEYNPKGEADPCLFASEMKKVKIEKVSINDNSSKIDENLLPPISTLSKGLKM